MPEIDDDDLAEIFSADEFGITVAVINGSDVPGHFSNEYFETLDVSGTQPVFTCSVLALSAVTPAVSNGTTITLNSTSYIIETIKPDGTGKTKLILEDQS